MIKKIIILAALFCGVCIAEAQTQDELFGKSSTKDPSKWETRGGYALLREVYAAYDTMAAAAAKDGIKLTIVSAYRSFDHQKGIWERKWNDANRAKMSPRQRALDILRYSSMPSTSRHHWGTDFDLNSVQPSYFESGQGKKIYEWLEKNASKFGFFQPYTSGRTKGYATEKWHWSYRKIADVYEKTYVETVKNSDIKGFLGSNIAEEIGVINGWVRLK